MWTVAETKAATIVLQALADEVEVWDLPPDSEQLISLSMIVHQYLEADWIVNDAIERGVTREEFARVFADMVRAQIPFLEPAKAAATAATLGLLEEFIAGRVTDDAASTARSGYAQDDHIAAIVIFDWLRVGVVDCEASSVVRRIMRDVEDADAALRALRARLEPEPAKTLDRPKAKPAKHRGRRAASE